MLFERIFLLQASLNPFIGKARLKGFTPIIRVRAKGVNKISQISDIIGSDIYIGNACKVTVSTLSVGIRCESHAYELTDAAP